MLNLKNLKIDGRTSPLDASLSPSFSWEYGDDSDEEPSSYRLTVLEGENVIFDSGDRKVVRNFALVEPQLRLAYRHAYEVSLSVVSSSGKISTISAPFETRPSESDFKGTWIGAPSTWNGGALAIRKELPPLETEHLVRARLYCAGIGYCEAYVNGKKLGDAVLEPGVTDYDKKILYSTYDLLPYLRKGQNVLGFLLGYGWYGNRKLKAQAYFLYDDGHEEEVHSFSNYQWWFAPSPIEKNSIYSGEIYDARIEDDYPDGFSSPDLMGGYNSKWFGSIHSQQRMGKLVPEEMPKIRILGEYPGECIHSFDAHDFIYDVKQNIAGFCRIEVEGKRGSKVILRHGETLKADGHLDQTNLRTAAQEDVYILKGEGKEIYQPRFTYHGFRYVEVKTEGDVKLISLTGLHVHTDNEEVGRFFCDDEILNKLHKMAVITEQNNETSILTDCPQRDERFGWLNDVSSRIYQIPYNFDVELMLRKVDEDISLTQDEEGAITDTAPYYTGGRPADTTSLSYLLLARESYRYYGDKKIVKENYAGHKKWVDFLLSHQVGFIMDYAYYADWVSCVNFPDGGSDPICISSLFLYWHLKTLAELAAILGKKKDQNHYTYLSKLSRASLRAKYLHEDHFHEGTQAEDAMALSLGIVNPGEEEKKVYAHLRDSVISHGNHLTCGNQGYRHAFYELCEHGDVELALQVLRNPEYPGWGFMVANGATTVWERWEKENKAVMNSFDHPMFASYDAIFYRYLLGIKVNDIVSNDIEVAPKISTSLSHAEGSLKTRRGVLSVSWKKEGGELRLFLDIPVSMQVKVTIPGEKPTLAGEKVEPVMTLGHGHYEFVSRISK